MVTDTTTMLRAAHCGNCDGYGVVPSKSGLMTPDLNTLLQPSKKGGGGMTLAQAQEHIKKMAAIAARDTTVNTICPKCGGHGR